MTEWEGDSQGIVPEIKIWPYYQKVYAQNRIHPSKWDSHKILWDVEIPAVLKARPSVNWQQIRERFVLWILLIQRTTEGK